MKIMMVITGMRSGGAERVMSTLCNELSKTNQVRLVVLKEKISDYALSEKIDFVAGNIANKNLFKSIKFVQNQIDEWRPDIILSFMTKSNIIALSAMKKAKVKAPVVIAERANPYYTKGILNIIRKHLYKEANGCVFQTKQAQEYYKDILKCNSIIIRNPLNPDFKVDTFTGTRKKKIVCTARLSKEKNQKLLIDSFCKISAKYPEYIVEFYGSGPLDKKLQNYINKLKMNEKIFLKGRKNNIQQYIRDAEIFVLPSNSEGMPNALLEAMALGIACISTDCPIGGPAEIINNNKNGILVPMNDVNKMSENIEKLIVDKEFARKIGNNARNVINDFETVKVCKEWEEYLLKITKEYN